MSAAGAWLRAAALAAPSLPPWPSDAEGAAIAALAERHRLAARAGARVAARGDAPAWAGALVGSWRRALGDVALFQDELARLGAGAAARGVTLVALKGADLATRLYGPGERPSNDLDLLVAPGQLDTIDAVLTASGYASDHPAPGRARASWFATTYRNTARPRVQVDLHWGLGTPGRTQWDIPAVLARAEPVPERPGVARLAADDLWLHLALHAVAFHGAAGRWIWWLDLALLANVHPPPSPEVAARAGARVALEAARLRTAALFGGSGEGLRAGARARVIANLGALFEDAELTRGRRWLVAALAVDRGRDLLRVARDVVRRPA